MGCRCSLYRETQSREQRVVTSKAIRKGTVKANSIRQEEPAVTSESHQVRKYIFAFLFRAPMYARRKTKQNKKTPVDMQRAPRAQICKKVLSWSPRNESSCYFCKTNCSNILQNKIGQVIFFFFKKLKYEGSPIFMITKPILLVSPKPAFFLALRIMASE